MSRHGAWLRTTLLMTLLLAVVGTVIGRFFFIGPVYGKKLMQVGVEADTVIVGASHSATGINPEYIPNAVNVAQSGEPIFFTYYKTKQILEQNPHVKKLIISLSSIHVCPYAEFGFFNGNSASRIFSMNYFMLVDQYTDPLLPLFSSDRALASMKYGLGVPFNYMDDLGVVAKHYLGSLRSSDFEYYGGFEFTEGVHLNADAIAEKAQFYFQDDKGEATFSDAGMTSIARIFDLAVSNDVEVIVVNTPEHEIFRAHVPDKCRMGYDNFIAEHTARSPLIRHFDFSETPYEDRYFLDGDHLNTAGSNLLSKELAKLIGEG